MKWLTIVGIPAVALALFGVVWRAADFNIALSACAMLLGAAAYALSVWQSQMTWVQHVDEMGRRAAADLATRETGYVVVEERPRLYRIADSSFDIGVGLSVHNEGQVDFEVYRAEAVVRTGKHAAERVKVREGKGLDLVPAKGSIVKWVRLVGLDPKRFERVESLNVFTKRETQIEMREQHRESLSIAIRDVFNTAE